MARINLEGTMLDVMVAMSEGNPGAVSVLANIIKYSRMIDRNIDPFLAIMWLDEWEVYGSSIWILYKDVCEESLVNLMALIRYKQLGLCPVGYDMFGEQDFNSMKAAVCEKLPGFNTEVGHALYS